MKKRHNTVRRSLWYLHPRLYDLGMLLINGTFYLRIYREIAHCIPAKATVLDAGAGSCLLAKYLHFSVDYEAWDANECFVTANARSGIRVFLKNCLTDPFPEKDFIIISGVLHHIHPNEHLLVEKALAAARKGVIVVEPFADPDKNTRRIYRWLRNIRRKTFLERFLGEYDGTNSPNTIFIQTKEGLLTFLDSFGKNTQSYIGDEIIAVYTK